VLVIAGDVTVAGTAFKDIAYARSATFIRST
jgi:hypothetical protein